MKRLLLALALAGTAAAEEAVREAPSLPHEFTFEAPQAGYLTAEIVEPPEKLDARLEFAEPREWPISRDTRTARVEAGTVKLRLLHAWGKFESPVRFRITFRAEDDASEPNGTPEQARAVKVGEALSMRLTPAGEHDVLRVEVAEPGYLVAEFTGAPDDVEAGFSLDEQHALAVNMARIDWPGEVFVTVAHHWRRQVDQAFSVTFRFIPEDDLNEPNDDPRDAAQLILGEWTQARFAPAREADWFAFATDRPGYLALDVDAEHPPEAKFELFAADAKTRLAEGAILQVPAGEFLLHASSRWGRPSPGAFLLRPRFIPEPDDTGPNDDRERPATVATDTWIRLGIPAVGDRDWLSLEIPADGRLAFRSRGRLPNSLVVAWVGADGKEERISPSPGRVRPGRRLLVVRTDWNSISADSFDLRFDLLPDDDPLEPNDTLADATPLPLGTALDVILDPRDDEDWFALDIPGEGTLYVLTSGDPGYPHSVPEIALHDAAGKPAGRFAQAPTGPARALAVTPGRWFLRATPARAQHRFRIVAVLASPGTVERAKGGDLSVAIIGLDVDESTLAGLKALAASSGGSFRDTKDAAGLSREMAKVVEESKKEAAATETTPPSELKVRLIWLPYVGAGVVLLIIAILAARRLFRM